MIQVLVADSIQEDGLQPLLDMDNVEVIQQKVDSPHVQLERIEALLVRSATKVNEELLEKMPQLKIIARAGVGVDNIDVAAATKKGIIVVNAPDGNTISTAEHTFAMMASLVRRIPQAHQSVKNLEWKRNHFIGSELYGKNLGIIGLGRIGTELSKRAKVFGMNVHVFDPFLTKDRALKLGVHLQDLQGVLKEADIITVHTPLTPQTKGLLNKETLPLTKTGVYILNCARGGIIDEEALAEAISSGHVAGAALDVFVNEPPGDHPLVKLEEVIVTPHLGASTKEAQLNVATQVAKEVRLFLEDKPVANSINLPSMSKDIFEKIRPFHPLAKKMGSMISQLMKQPVQELSISYSGTVTDLETTYLTKALLSGFFTDRIDGYVNEVNALHTAKERDIKVGEKITSHSFGYTNSISVTAKGENQQFTMIGTYIENYGPRIIRLNDFSIDFHPEGNLVYIQHMDRPGVIGRVGQILGSQEINIATMQVGRKELGGEAIMLLSFDKHLEDEPFHYLEALDDIVSINRIVV
jgi:D-3-phosphoglycerate dehydrogenase